MGKKLNREEALALFGRCNKSEALTKHALAVEGVMRHFANIFGENEDEWGVIGLLHDLDYEMYPSEHCVKCQEIMRAEDVDESIVRAVASHGYGIVVDIKPESNAEKVLYTVDE
jgi:putative nucleotidyltransferase with HDIG domain